METPVTFRNQGQQIVGMLHLPQPFSASKLPAVALFHGFTGTHIEPHRLFVHTARALARAGIVALRFDFRGSGDSEGEFQDMTVAGEVFDGLAALAFLSQQPQVDSKRLGILGLSLGGAVAMLVAARLSECSSRSNASMLHDLRSLSLWAAPAQGRDLIAARTDPIAIESLKKHGYADRMGNPVGKQFIDEYENMVQRDELKNSDCPVLIVHGEADQSVPVEHAHRLGECARKPNRRVEKLIIPDADHTFNRLDWQQQAIEATVRWFAETL